MKIKSAGLALLFSASLAPSGGRADSRLEIIEPAAGAAVYSQEVVRFEARWTASGAPDAAAEALSYVWSSDADGEIARGLRASVQGLSYRTHKITLRALSGDSLLGTAETTLSVIVRPDQFTLSERSDWEGEFSPSGKQVAYTSYRSGDPEIWVASLANRASDRITFKGGMSPVWSPDGRWLVFWSERSGNRDLWLVVLGEAGRNAVQLTSLAGAEWMPDFNPLDNRIVFVSKTGRRSSLMVLAADLPEEGAQVLLEASEYPLFPRWFPDGRDLLFTSYRDTLPVVCRLDTERQAVIRLSGPGAEDADISPDGSRLVFVRNGEIWLERLQDGFERPLTRESAGALSPRFAPDGMKIIYASTRSGNYDLWLLDLPLEN